MKYYKTVPEYVLAWKYDGMGIVNTPYWIREISALRGFDFSISQYGNTIIVDSNLICEEGMWIVFDKNDILTVMNEEEFTDRYEVG